MSVIPLFRTAGFEPNASETGFPSIFMMTNPFLLELAATIVAEELVTVAVVGEEAGYPLQGRAAWLLGDCYCLHRAQRHWTPCRRSQGDKMAQTLGAWG